MCNISLKIRKNYVNFFMFIAICRLLNVLTTNTANTGVARWRRILNRIFSQCYRLNIFDDLIKRKSVLKISDRNLAPECDPPVISKHTRVDLWVLLTKITRTHTQTKPQKLDF